MNFHTTFFIYFICSLQTKMKSNSRKKLRTCKKSISRKKSHFFQKKVPTDDYVFYLRFMHICSEWKKNSSLCQWFVTRICTIVPSIKAAMRRNNVQVFRIHFFVHSLHSVEETKIWKYFVKLIFCFTVCCFLDSRNFRQSNIESQI